MYVVTEKNNNRIHKEMKIVFLELYLSPASVTNWVERLMVTPQMLICPDVVDQSQRAMGEMQQE